MGTKLMQYITLATILICVSAQTFKSDHITIIKQDQLLSDQVQEMKTLKRYQMKIESKPDTAAHLSFTAFAKSFESDPDLFISKSTDREYPTSASNARWYSEAEGTDSVIIPFSQVQVGDIFFITVSCLNECYYDFRTYFTPEINVKDTQNTVFRWGGHSTTILKFDIPELASSGLTEQLEIRIMPEGDYKHITAHLSFDSSFSIVEDRPTRHVIDNGLAITLNKYDYRFCVRCTVYVIVNMIEDRRVYITAKASPIDTSLINLVPRRFLISQGKTECLTYTVQQALWTQMYRVKNFEGVSDIFLSRRSKPNSIKSSSVKMISKSKSPQQALIVTPLDRIYWGSDLSNFYFCANAYDSFSAYASITDQEMQGVYQGEKLTEYTMFLHKNSTAQFVFTEDEFKTQDVEINFKASVQTMSTGDKTDLQIHYKVCTYEPCSLDEQSARGNGVNVIKPKVEKKTNLSGDTSRQQVETTYFYTGQIKHIPSQCRSQQVCKYIFSVYNPSEQNLMRQTTFFADFIASQIQDAMPGEEFINISEMDRYTYYQVTDSDVNLSYIQELRFELITYIGDADLYIATGHNNKRPTKYSYTFASENRDMYDEIILKNSSSNWLSDHIHIGVYANERSEYRLKIIPTYSPSAKKSLKIAHPMVDGKAIYDVFENDFDFTMVSFMPWWSHHEEKTVCMFSQSNDDRLTFYLAVDKIPMMTEFVMEDHKQMYSLRPHSEHYVQPDPTIGHAYYIRIRQNYTISGFLDKTEQQFYFWAFTQPSGLNYKDIYAGDVLVGMAFQDMNTFYRHYITDKTQTIQITLNSYPGKGSPKLLVKIKNDRVFPETGVPESYDFKAQATTDRTEATINVHSLKRIYEEPDCNNAGYQLSGGNKACTIYIGVECDKGEEMCAFALSLNLYDYTNIAANLGNKVTENPPKYIPDDVDYVDGVINFGQTHFYYLPYVASWGDLVVMLNKTNPIDKGGAISLSMSVEPNGQNSYTNWNMPTIRKHAVKSQTNDPITPEIIDMEGAKLKQVCYNSNNCVLIFMVYGQTHYESKYRLRVFRGEEKLHENTPAFATINPGEFKYYWFMQIDGIFAKADNPYWQSIIAVGSKTPGTDVDMYVSVFDGRYPTVSDYDFKSTNKGSDHVVLRSDDPIFIRQHPYDYAANAGVAVVVGIHNSGSKTAQFSLIQRKSLPDVTVENFITNEAKTVTFLANHKRSESSKAMRVFKWYNWEHGNFNVQLTKISGRAKLYLNYVGESNFEDSIYSGGIPTSNNDAVWAASVDDTSSRTQDISIYRKDTSKQPVFCYNCFYYLTVETDDPRETSIRIFVSRLADIGNDYSKMELGKTSQFQIPSINSFRFAKFILDSKDSFEIETTVSSGKAKIIVSSNPETLQIKPDWQLEQEIGTGYIKVRSDDPKFHMGTMYYVGIQNLAPSNTFVSLKLKQFRTVTNVANNAPTKLQFMTDRELVKFMVFQVPQEWSKRAETTITVENISDHIYPSIYTKLVEVDFQPEDEETLPFPTVVDYDHSFGTDPIQVLKSDTATYKLETVAVKPYAYLTMAVYQNTYGLTDRRKPEFKLTMSSKEIVNPTVSQPNLSSTELEGRNLSSSDQAGEPQQESWQNEAEVKTKEFLQN